MLLDQIVAKELWVRKVAQGPGQYLGLGTERVRMLNPDMHEKKGGSGVFGRSRLQEVSDVREKVACKQKKVTEIVQGPGVGTPSVQVFARN
jgi:hypothetical protein